MRIPSVCRIAGHKYRVLQTFSLDTRRVGCNRCAGDWAMNDRLQVLVKWDSSFARIYSSEQGCMTVPVSVLREIWKTIDLNGPGWAFHEALSKLPRPEKEAGIT